MDETSANEMSAQEIPEQVCPLERKDSSHAMLQKTRLHWEALAIEMGFLQTQAIIQTDRSTSQTPTFQGWSCSMPARTG